MTYECRRRERCLPFRTGLPQVRLWHTCCRFLAPHSAHRLISQRALPAKYHAAPQELVPLNLTPEITKTHQAKLFNSEVSKSANAHSTLHSHTVLLRYRFHVCPCTRVRAHTKTTEIMQLISVHVEQTITPMQVRNKNAAETRSCLRRSWRGYYHLIWWVYSIHPTKGKKIKASHPVLLSHK